MSGAFSNKEISCRRKTNISYPPCQPVHAVWCNKYGVARYRVTGRVFWIVSLRCFCDNESVLVKKKTANPNYNRSFHLVTISVLAPRRVEFSYFQYVEITSFGTFIDVIQSVFLCCNCFCNGEWQPTYFQIMSLTLNAVASLKMAFASILVAHSLATASLVG